MARAGDLKLEVNVEKGEGFKELEAAQQKVDEFKRRVDQICVSTLHSQLARVGIKYSVSACAWQFLDVCQEKDLGALLYKLFELHRWQPTTKLLLDDLREKGGYEEFCEWAAEYGIHLQAEGEGGMERCKIIFNRITDQKELPEEDPPPELG